jgi:hypothetical protein
MAVFHSVFGLIAHPLTDKGVNRQYMTNEHNSLQTNQNTSEKCYFENTLPYRIHGSEPC